MAAPDSSSPPIPFDIIAMILRFALATPTPVPPNAVDRQLRTSTLTLNHEIRDVFVKDIYNTVVLWSMGSIRMFAATLDTSPRLGSLVVNLWAGNNAIKLIQPAKQGEVVKNGCEDVVHCLIRILAAMPNLQRLYIAANFEEYWHKIECPIPDSLRHLVLPSHWLDNTRPVVIKGSRVYIIPPNLESFRIRGRPQGTDALLLVNASSRPLRIITEIHQYHEDDFSEITAILLAVLNPMNRPPWESSIEVVSPPAIFERSRAAIVRFGSTHGSFFRGMFRVSVVSQPLDDVGQLDLWLSEGESSPFGPF